MPRQEQLLRSSIKQSMLSYYGKNQTNTLFASFPYFILYYIIEVSQYIFIFGNTS